jgi:hypothetical protein
VARRTSGDPDYLFDALRRDWRLEADMNADDPIRINIARRILGLALGTAPLWLMFASMGFGLAVPERPLFAGAGFMAAAMVCAVLNFNLSFVRPRLHFSRHGDMGNYRHVSGFPGIGTALALLGTLFGFGAIGTAVLGLAVMALDTGGSLWFLVSTWRDRSFWDA